MNQSSISMSLVGANVEPGDFKSTIVFRIIEKALQENTEKNSKALPATIKGIFCFRIKNGEGREGVWILDVKDGKGTVKFNGKEKPDVTLVMNDTDVVDLMMGKLNPQKAFFQGKLKISGNMGLVMQLSVLQEQTKNIMEKIKAKL